MQTLFKRGDGEALHECWRRYLFFISGVNVTQTGLFHILCVLLFGEQSP